MRGIFTLFALLVLVGGTAAIAQTGTGTGSSARSAGASSNKGGIPEAPVGHRQPRPGDVPSASDDASRMNAEDAALDRRIKSICRGC